jgi:hypothetical protein
MRLGDSAFFNLFKRLGAVSRPSRDSDEWNVSGAHWTLHRHISVAHVSFQIETHMVRVAGTAGQCKA